MTVYEAFNAAVEKAADDGQLDRELHGAIIEAARRVAAVMDEPEWRIVRGKIDNVSPAVFLKYCERLGLTVEEAKRKKETKEVKITAVGNSKWKKQA